MRCLARSSKALCAAAWAAISVPGCFFGLEDVETATHDGGSSYVNDAGSEAVDAPVDAVVDAGDVTEGSTPDVPSGDGCWPASDDKFCADHGIVCGVFEADECGSARQVDCGTCGTGLDCVDGACLGYTWKSGAWSSCSASCQ